MVDGSSIVMSRDSNVRTFLLIPIVAAALLVSPASAFAYDPGVAVTVDTWSSDNGHGYVGVKANGTWAPPDKVRERVRTEFYSEWQPQGDPAAYSHFWWVFVHRTADGSTVNFDNPIVTFTKSTEPGIGIQPTAYGDLSLYLAVAVEPVIAPARSERTVTAELTTGWRDWVDDAISAYVVRDSIAVQRWTVDFGDGTRRTFPGSGDRLTTTHAYEAGRFDVIVTARVTGQAYGAFFAPDGTPFEDVVPFALDISNRASGVSALPIEYVPPVVTVGGSPSGRSRTARSSRRMPTATPRSGGRAACPAPSTSARSSSARGSCARAASSSAARPRGSSGIATRAASTTRRTPRDPPPTRPPSPSGSSGTRRCPAKPPIPVRLVLELETTYDDGTVRTSEVDGSIAVTVVYSAVTH